MTKADTAHPDAWGAGLWFKAKPLNTKRVPRAATPAEVVPVCLAHNLRQGNEDHRHRSAIDLARTPLNEVLRGPASLAVAVELVQSILDEFDLTPRRRDTIMAVELVMQPPDDADAPAFWSECLAWADARYQHVISAVIHRDQKRPHMHLLALAVVDGRLAGDELTSGTQRTSLQCRDFFRHMRDALGTRRDRPAKTLTQLATSAGRGPKSRTEAARRDAALVRSAGADWRQPPCPAKNSGYGGSGAEMGNPHAQPKNSTPFLRSVSTHSHGADARASGSPKTPPADRPAGSTSTPPPTAPQKPEPTSTTPTSTSPPPAPPTIHRPRPPAPASPPDADDSPGFSRERDSDREAGQWCEVRGEFVSVPTRPKAARAEAESWVRAALADRAKGSQNARSASR